MRRLLLLVVAVFALFWWISRALAGLRRPPAPSRAPGRSGRQDLATGAPMVRDRVCNTFLPRERALTAQRGSEEFFFCSEGCRDSFLAERPR